MVFILRRGPDAVGIRAILASFWHIITILLSNVFSLDDLADRLAGIIGDDEEEEMTWGDQFKA